MAIDDHQAPAALPAAEHLLGGLYTGTQILQTVNQRLLTISLIVDHIEQY